MPLYEETAGNDAISGSAGDDTIYCLSLPRRRPSAVEARTREALLCTGEDPAGVRLDRDARSRTHPHVVPAEPERGSVVTLHVAPCRVENDRRLPVEPDFDIVVECDSAGRVRAQRRVGDKPSQF